MEENPGAAGSGLQSKANDARTTREKKAYRERKFQEAVAAYKEAVEQAGGSPSPQIHLGYGKALFQTGSYDQRCDISFGPTEEEPPTEKLTAS